MIVGDSCFLVLENEALRKNHPTTEFFASIMWIMFLWGININNRAGLYACAALVCRIMLCAHGVVVFFA